MKWKLIVFSAFFFSASAFALLNDAATKVKWGYKGDSGPIQWAELDPSFKLCAQGKLQSPIDIGKRVPSGNQSLAIHYSGAPLTIAEDIITQILIGDTQTVINDGHSVQVNFPDVSIPEMITFQNQTYRLVQLHFHSPSENTWRGRAFPMEIHFVHQGDHGQLAVIAVFVKGGEGNDTLQKIIDHLPSVKGQAFTIQGENIDPANLLPNVLDYYAFKGSRTTACQEKQPKENKLDVRKKFNA